MENIKNLKKKLRFSMPADKIRCTSNGLPTKEFDALLKGCMAPTEAPASTANALLDNCLMILVTNRKFSPFKTSSSKYITTRKGFLLLKALSKRETFKPFFDAYAGHLSEKYFDAYYMTSMANLDTLPFPQWIFKGKKIHKHDGFHSKNKSFIERFAGYE